MPTGDDQGRVESEIQEILARTASDGATAAPQGAREPLDRELRNIKETVIRMGSMAIGDRKINDMQHEVITAITTTIATQSPVARDLRNLLMMNHVVYELERIGDHAASVAKIAVQLAPEPALQRYLHLPEIGELAATQLHGILMALVDVDPVRAREVAVSDDQIDALYRQSFDECIRLMEADKSNVARGTRLLFAAHYLERIGDRTTNIAEDIVYLASGEVEDLNP
ncbi:MAG: phosphate transport system regulatory protein PhoU [Candidatus Aquidulcis sp.]|nr:MAG: phosphate transport system regulatory protein PhoU [Candidatus Aquidulcis sp.]